MGSWNDAKKKPNWHKIDEENELRHRDDVKAAMKISSAHRDFFEATERARRGARDGGFFPHRDAEGDLVYSETQARAAACQSREDVAASMHIQLHLLQRLDRNRTLMWIAIGLLTYIAFRVS